MSRTLETANSTTAEPTPSPLPTFLCEHSEHRKDRERGAPPQTANRIEKIMSTQTEPDTLSLELGRVVTTAGVAKLVEDNPLVGHLHLQMLLGRHQSADWGDVCLEDWALNDQAHASGEERILSSYELYGEKVWIITEWDRSVTTVLFPDEY